MIDEVMDIGSPGKSLRVYLVEDEVIIAMDAKSHLRRIGCTVVGHSRDGATAVLDAVRMHPDVVLMDIKLAGPIDGIQAAEQIAVQCDCAVVFQTASSDQETLDRVKHLQPYGFIVKPFDEFELRKTLEMAHVAHVNARAIRASEERLKFAIEGSGDGIWEYSTTTHLLSLSARSACILGLPENEVHMEVEDFLSLAHPDDRERVGASLNECFLAPSREVGEECRILRPAGEVGWVLLRGKALGGSRSGTERRIFGTLSDITSRKHGEQLLERERLLLKTLIDTLPAHIYVKDREHRFVHCNSSVVNALGAASADEILGNTDEAYFSPVIVGQYREEEDRILSGEASSVHHENAIRYPDGQYRWMTSTKVPIKGPNGEIDLLVGINVDITARRRMEDALKASEARYRELADTLPEMVFEADALGIITFVNLRATQILGRGEAEILNRASVFDFLAAGDVERARTTARKILTEGTSSKGHYTLIHHNGSHIPVMVHTSPIVKHGVATGIRGVVVELRSMVVNDPLSLPSSPNVRRTPLETPVEQAGTNHG